ncbi:glycosyltransferase family 2 protein [Enterocloster lavalensis]|uniref:glycosyltransferase family 2 protein n=1 Tax=Enterocloster lavalensis TaxID=460384 RepID=UPI000D1AB00A|nr:glycosyltransferase family 2 protein [Enterocloster lavalensis]PST29225.1 glycosyl transferase family 2 [Enterocloster lavalensis]
MEKILTIVVPTYNAEKYLRDNLESFCIPKLFPDLEVLIINDGSTDHSADIAEEYVKLYPDTYKLITKKNGGHGSGINTGILNATGKYFKVVDADDWVEKETFIKLIETLKKSDSDIVASGFYWVYDEGQENKEEFVRKAEMKIPFSGVDYQKEYLFDEVADQIYVKMHHMTIKTSILREHEIRVDEHCYYVDTEYITYPIPYVETIRFVDGFVYMYRLGRQGQSVSMEKMQSNEKNYDRVIESLLTFYGDLEKKSLCTQKKKQYIARIIARVVAGKVKIMLSFPTTSSKKESLLAFDKYLKLNYPAVYYSNINSSLKLLRGTHFLLYTVASILVRRKYR